MEELCFVKLLDKYAHRAFARVGIRYRDVATTAEQDAKKAKHEVASLEHGRRGQGRGKATGKAAKKAGKTTAHVAEDAAKETAHVTRRRRTKSRKR